jgi:hypothetical protein
MRGCRVLKCGARALEVFRVAYDNPAQPTVHMPLTTTSLQFLLGPFPQGVSWFVPLLGAMGCVPPVDPLRGRTDALGGSIDDAAGCGKTEVDKVIYRNA